MKKILFILLVLVPGLCNAQQWEKIDCGTEFSVGIKSDGTLWSWGFNGNGQLGQGTTTAQNLPTQIGNATNWKDVATGSFHCLAIKTDGTLWSWGLNGTGQLGDGTLVQQNMPIQIGTATNWKSVEAGFVHSLAIKNDNTLWSWGYNSNGQLGIGSTVDTSRPVQVGTATNWKQISAGGAHTIALQNDGSLWSWGANTTGQLGLGNTTDSNIPTRVGTNTNWTMVSAGFEFSLGLQSDASIWSWGFNGNSQLGDDGLGAQQTSPVNFEISKDWKLIEAGASFGFAIKNDNRLFTWGFNGSGQLGVASTVQQDNIVQVGTDTDWEMIAGADGANINNSILGVHTLALKNPKNAICGTGGNYQGQLGDGTTFDTDQFNCNIGVLNVGVNDYSLNEDVKIYPNPTNGIINIESSSSVKIERFKLYSLTGQVLKKLDMDNNVSIDISDIPPGAYVLELEGEGLFFRERLIID